LRKAFRRTLFDVRLISKVLWGEIAETVFCRAGFISKEFVIRNEAKSSSAPRPGLGLALALLWGYFSAVFLLGEYRLPIDFGPGRWLLSIVIVLLAGHLVGRRVVKTQRISASRLTNLRLMAAVTIIGLIGADITYSMYLNSMKTSFDLNKARVFDQNVWVSELYPKIYYPTERNFALHKPNVIVSGEPFGNFYSEPMRQSPTLMASVLERSAVTIRINELGFRESSDISSAEIFTLGDSFTFGWGVNEHESWPGLLETQLDQPIYNLGIHDASPRQELELLKFVLKKHSGELRIRKLLWMIYEGNDLEDDYSEKVRRYDASEHVPLANGTLIDAAQKLLWTLKRQSVIHKIRRGQITWKTVTGGSASDPYEVDGVRLVYPLYHSQQLGPRLFSSTYVSLAGTSSDYVETHWNREALESVFAEMKSLADEFDFEVAVITAPTAARLHGPHFYNFPEISKRPHFLDFVIALSESAGFPTVDLFELLQPYAGNELLYFRDDDHFNHRGNALAAELIEQELFTAQD
jgi:hypothetical protein